MSESTPTAPDTTTSTSTTAPPAAPLFNFGSAASGTGGGFSFAGFGAAAASSAPAASAGGAKDKDEDGEGDDDNEPVPEEESTATFAPVVQLEVVEVKTHEEDETVVYKQRAKLFLYGETLLDKGTGVKSWKERGVGDIKLLRHKESNRIRVLMRQEKTMKVLTNFFLDPRIHLVPNAGSDKSWVWNCFDFAEGDLVETTFAVRFSSTELAGEFKAAFESGQKEMEALMAGADAATGSAEADAAADAVAAVSLKSEATPAADKESAEK